MSRNEVATKRTTLHKLWKQRFHEEVNTADQHEEGMKSLSL